MSNEMSNEMSKKKQEFNTKYHFTIQYSEICETNQLKTFG